MNNKNKLDNIKSNLFSEKDNQNSKNNDILYLKKKKKRIPKLFKTEKIKENKKSINNQIEKEKKEINFEDDFISNPKNIQIFKDLKVDDAYNIELLDNTFCVFKSITEILYLIYANRKNSIICYNLINDQIINEIKNPHDNQEIINFRYFLDKNNKRDLIISVSSENNNIKLWDINGWVCLQNFKDIYEDIYIGSACFLLNNNQIFIISSGFDPLDFLYEPIKIYNLEGNIVNEIMVENMIYFVDIYYDKNLSKIFIIVGDEIGAVSYDYNDGKAKIFKEYYEEGFIEGCKSIIINDKEKIIKLIASTYLGYIKIWDFHSGELLNLIEANDTQLYGISLWDNKHLFVSCEDNESEIKKIKLIDLNTGKIKKILSSYNGLILTIKKLNHPKYGECLITQCWGGNSIQLIINKNKSF